MSTKKLQKEIELLRELVRAKDALIVELSKNKPIWVWQPYIAPHPYYSMAGSAGTVTTITSATNPGATYTLTGAYS